jgi:putative aminopeptidase FrvX
MKIEKILEELIFVPGVSGFEDPIRERITTFIKDSLDRIEVDALGNLIGIREGEGKGHLAFFAHMDELGLVVANITTDGFICFRKVGGIDDRILPSRHVKLLTAGGKEIPGVIAWVPPHMAADRPGDLERIISWQNLVIDVGAHDAEEVKAMGIRIGNPVVFSKQISRLAHGLISSRGIDNRAGCSVLIDVIKSLKGLSLSPQITFVFTTQEEYGLRGASAAGYNFKPDSAFIVDTASAPDFPGVPVTYKGQFQIGKGPLMRLVDVRMVANQALWRFVEKLAGQHNIPLQSGVVGGSTDAAAVQLMKGGVPVLPICIPCRYTHATVETISIHDLEMTAGLLREIVRSYSV